MASFSLSIFLKFYLTVLNFILSSDGVLILGLTMFVSGYNFL